VRDPEDCRELRQESFRICKGKKASGRVAGCFLVKFGFAERNILFEEAKFAFGKRNSAKVIAKSIFSALLLYSAVFSG